MQVNDKSILTKRCFAVVYGESTQDAAISSCFSSHWTDFHNMAYRI